MRNQLAKAWKSLYSADWWWVLVAALAAMASMHSFAQIQRTLLASAGVRVQQWRSEAAFYAGNALSTTMPGGPVLSATFIYRQQRLWGASPLVASWQLVMSGVLQVVGLALLGLGQIVLAHPEKKDAYLPAMRRAAKHLATPATLARPDRVIIMSPYEGRGMTSTKTKKLNRSPVSRAPLTPAVTSRTNGG